jgi:hypothetical protein
LERSLVYSHIAIYRIVMNLLYAGGYSARFRNILDLFGPDVRSVCDLCFGDTLIAETCRSRDIEWTGIDVNRYFCDRASQRGHRAIEGELFSVDLPKADVYVMAGSLYHFHDRLGPLLDRILARTDRFLLSEPIRNLSSSGGLLARFAKRSADPGTGDAPFRYCESSLQEALRSEQERIGFQMRIVSKKRDMLLEITR